MRKVILIAVGLLLMIYAGALAIPLDPDERRPGTRLSGDLIEEANPDWSFVQDRQQVYVQTNTWYRIPHSVTTISFVADGELYIPCGWCGDKRWPKNVEADPNVRVKIGEQLFDRRAVRIEDEATIRRILAVGHHDDLPDVVLFHMAPRT